MLIARALPRSSSFSVGFLSFVFVIALVLGTGFTPIAAQTYLQSQGVSRTTTIVPVESGWVDASNGRLHLEIPLGSYPQRGHRTDVVTLTYDSNIWSLSGTTWQPGGAWSWGGWRLVTSGNPGNVTFHESLTGTCPGGGDIWDNFNNFILTMPDGTTHAFSFTAKFNDCYGGAIKGSGYATDGSGYFMSADPTFYPPTILAIAPDGTSVTGGNEDSNGNYYSQDAHGNVIDTLGRTPVTTTTGSNTVTEQVLTADGTSSYTVTTSSVHISTNFGLSGQTNYSGAVTVVQSIQRPDLTSYVFTYDCDPSASGNSSTICGSPAGQGTYTGALKTMVLPTGGQITYGWNIFQDSQGNKYPWISQRSNSDGTTTYGQQTINSCGSGQVNCQQKFTVTRPLQDSTIYTFTLNGGVWPAEVQSYDSLSNLLSTTVMCYTFVTATNGQCSYAVTTATPATNVYLQWKTTTVPNATNSLSQTVEFARDAYGNVTSLSEWNSYVATLPSSPDRTTSLTYVNNSGYVSSNTVNRTQTTTVKDKNSNVISETINTYDGTSVTSLTGVANHDDKNYSTTNNTRGNLTQVQRLVGGTTFITTHMTYDMTGQVTTSTDSNGNVTSFSYADNFYIDQGNGQSLSPKSVSPATNAYLKTVTYPTVNNVTLKKTLGYYWGTGQPALSTDENSNTSYFHFYDSMSRPTAISLPNGGWIRTSYSSNDTIVDNYTGLTSGPPSGNSMPTCAGTSGGCRWDEIQLDGSGRPTYQILESDPDGVTTVAVTYDKDGRVSTISNPYRGTTNGVETLGYDGLARVSQVKHADNHIAYTYYGGSVASGGGATSQLCSSSYGSAYPVLSVDEVGNKRQIWKDGFGRVIETDEPNSSGSLTVGTCYSYDMNNNLIQVTSLGLAQTLKPTYTYDQLSRVTSKTLPETGTTYYYYTTSIGGTGLCSGDPSATCLRVAPLENQTNAANKVTTTYSYDALNRLLSKTYSDGTPGAYYAYDDPSFSGWTAQNPYGRLVSVGTYNGSYWLTGTWFSYDSAGNVNSIEQLLPGLGKIISYGHNLDGSVSSITYPGGRTVGYTEGNAQRMTQVADANDSINYVTPVPGGTMYTPFNTLLSDVHGHVNGGFAGIQESYSYNNRLQVTAIEATSSVSTPLNLVYSYVTGNNGNLATQTNNVSSGRTQNYTYDPLNRLLTAQTTAASGGDCWGQDFGNNATPPTLAADALANLFSTSSIQCTSPAPQYTMNSTNNNQFTGTGIGYDAAGNMTADTAYSYTYDAEGRIIAASGMSGGPYCYTYDVNNLRVAKANANGGSCTGTVTVDMAYWRDVSGQTIAETDGTGSTTNANYNEYVFFAGRRIAQSNPYSAKQYYYFVDHLGSTRAVTDQNGNACYEVDYLPYGTENTPAGFTNSCSSPPTFRYRFTGYERDLETAYGNSAGNDYAMARFYNSRLGRFMSGDPLDGDVSDPQSGNHYAYSGNNPINRVDPTGMYDCYDDRAEGGCVDGDSGNPSNLEDFSELDGGFGFGGFFDDPNCLGGDCSFLVEAQYKIQKTVFGFLEADQEACPMTDQGCQLQFQQLNIGTIPFGFPVSSPLPPGVGAALNAIARGLANDTNCAKLLGAGATQAINDMQQNVSGAAVGTATIPGQGNTINNATTFGGYGARTAINTIGAFYNSSVTTDRGQIAGGTPAAQAFILLHELGHVLGVLISDATKQADVDTNDKTLEKNCKKAIKSF